MKGVSTRTYMQVMKKSKNLFVGHEKGPYTYLQ